MSNQDFKRYAQEQARRVGRDLDITFHGFVESILTHVRYNHVDKDISFKEWLLESGERGQTNVYYRFDYKDKIIQLNLAWHVAFDCDDHDLARISKVIGDRMKDIDDEC